MAREQKLEKAEAAASAKPKAKAKDVGQKRKFTADDPGACAAEETPEALNGRTTEGEAARRSKVEEAYNRILDTGIPALQVELNGRKTYSVRPPPKPAVNDGNRKAIQVTLPSSSFYVFGPVEPEKWGEDWKDSYSATASSR